MVICLERDADLHMVQLMALSLASVKSRLVLPFWYRLTRVVLEKWPLNGCVCVCKGDGQNADVRTYGDTLAQTLNVPQFHNLPSGVARIWR